MFLYLIFLLLLLFLMFIECDINRYTETGHLNKQNKSKSFNKQWELTSEWYKQTNEKKKTNIKGTKKIIRNFVDFFLWRQNKFRVLDFKISQHQQQQRILYSIWKMKCQCTQTIMYSYNAIDLVYFRSTVSFKFWLKWIDFFFVTQAACYTILAKRVDFNWINLI